MCYLCNNWGAINWHFCCMLPMSMFTNGLVAVVRAHCTDVRRKTVDQNRVKIGHWRNHPGTSFHHSLHHGWTWRWTCEVRRVLHLLALWWTKSSGRQSLLPPAVGWCPEFYLCVFLNRNVDLDIAIFIEWFQQYPDKLLHLFHIMGAAHGKLSQPNFSAIPVFIRDICHFVDTSPIFSSKFDHKNTHQSRLSYAK